MSDQKMRLVLPAAPAVAQPVRRPLGRLLADRGLIKSSDLFAALSLQKVGEAHLGDWLLTQGLVSEHVLYKVLAEQNGAEFLCAADDPPQLHLQTNLDAHDCLTRLYVPWRKIGNATLVATARPDQFDVLRAHLPAHLHPVIMAVASPNEIEAAIRAGQNGELALQAELRLPEELSCRSLPSRIRPLIIGLGIVLILALTLQWLSFSTLYRWLFTLAVTMVLTGMVIKSAAALVHLSSPVPLFSKPPPLPERLPRFSLLIPLHDEGDILEALYQRLSLLDYPRALLDILLVVEADDTRTISHLNEKTLPPWMRILKVPKGNITTKPRALNYALPFCRGSLIGIYDAEDAPHPNQLKEVASKFAEEPQKTACIQAVLDFYNARSNALARFFAIEYATWFRLVLPGVARLGFAIPLGGTSVFFRRDVLHELHGWDAHNVTEDADLGIRLARAGFCTKLISSVTLEEANNAPWAWIKQRSRWLKGYLITYLTHMRRPLRLLIELGAWRFFGFQAFFLSSISQYMLAPLVWSCMLLYLGFPEFIQSALSASWLHTLMIAFIVMWCISTAIYCLAVWGPHHRHLLPWTLGMSVYMSLGTLAIYRGAWELITRPFYWDKTAHGHSEAYLDGVSTDPASSLSRVTKATEM